MAEFDQAAARRRSSSTLPRPAALAPPATLPHPPALPRPAALAPVRVDGAPSLPAVP